MTQLLIRDQSGERGVRLSKRIFTVGAGSSHDAQVSGERGKLIFTIVQRGAEQFEILPSEKLRLNGKSQSESIALQACDRIEWNGGTAVFWPNAESSPAEHASVGALKSLQVLQTFAANLSSKTALTLALNRILDHLIEVSGAETAYLISETLSEGGWALTAARHSDDLPSRRELFSNTVLLEALKKREVVCVESLVGHPWSQAHSVIASRVFSVACLPLIVDERVFGAMYLMTQTPGRSLRRERLAELNLLITQAALMMATQTELNRTQRENASLRRMVTDGTAGGIELGASQAMQDLARLVKKLAGVPLNVLVLGETGTGKEIISRAIHAQGPRAKGPFVAVNCAAIPETLLESTLFGHERGAFTGAVRAQTGKFQQAHGGTLLLDEIGELPLELQAKLLRVLQEKAVEPVGGREPKPVDVRVLAATHQNLEQAVREGKFRQDLYFRLNGAIVMIPPLRERREDILPLARHFLKRVDSPIHFSEAALRALEQHPWPGNVRELEQVVTRAALLSESDVIQPEDLQLGAPVSTTVEAETFWQNLKEAQAHFTRDYVNRVLVRNEQDRAATAAELGISERSLYRILAGTDNSGSET